MEEVEVLAKLDHHSVTDSVFSENNSILTRLTADSDSIIEEYFLELYIDKDSDDEADIHPFQFKNYQKVKVEKSPEQKKSDIYEAECKRYGLRAINLVKDAIWGDVDCIDLKNYGVGSLHLQIIFKVLESSPTSKIVDLDLTYNVFSKFACYTLADFMQQSLSLKKLILKGCKVGLRGIEILTDGIMLSTSIEHLDLSNCNLKDEGGKIVVNALARNDILKVINLSDNFLGIQTAQAFEKTFFENSTLIDVNLSYNNMCDEAGIVPLLQGVAKNTSLKKLNLSWNLLSGKMLAKALFRCVRRSKSLKSFNLSFNRLSTIEARKLAVGLKKSEAMEEIYLEQNLFDWLDLVTLLNVFRVNPKLRLMDFGREFHMPVDADLVIAEIKEERPDVEIIYRGRLLPQPVMEVNIKDVCADRAKYLAMAPKKKKAQRDMGHFMLKLKSMEQPYISKSEFLDLLEKFKAKNLDKELLDEYVLAFIEIILVQGREIIAMNAHKMADHYLQRHPTNPPVKKTRKKTKLKQLLRKSK